MNVNTNLEEFSFNYPLGEMIQASIGPNNDISKAHPSPFKRLPSSTNICPQSPALLGEKKSQLV